MLGYMESMKDVVVIVEEDVCRACPVLQNGDHFPLQASILVPHQGGQAPVGQAIDTSSPRRIS